MERLFGYRRVAVLCLVTTPLMFRTGSATAADAAAPERPSRPCLVLPEPDYQAGRMEPGPNLCVTFPVRNDGEEPLRILRARPDCGCTVAAFDREIPPLGTGTVRATLRTVALRGRLAKHIQLETDDPDRPSSILTLHVELVEPIRVEPGMEFTVPVQRGLVAVEEVRVTVSQAAPLEISGIESSAPYLRARVATPAPSASEVMATGRNTVTLEVIVSGNAPAELFEQTLTLTTNSARFPRLTLTVHGFPRGSIAVSPPRLRFEGLPAAAPAEVFRSATLSHRSPFRVLSATTDVPGFTAKLYHDNSGRFWEVRVIYSGGSSPGSHTGMIHIETDDPLRPTIDLPFVADVS